MVCHRQGKDVTLITYGTLLENVMQAAELLHAQNVEATVVRLTAVAPLPVKQSVNQRSENHHVVVVEETCSGSGIREALAWELHHAVSDIRVDGIDLGLRFIPHGEMNTLYTAYGLDAESVANYVQEVLNVEN